MIRKKLRLPIGNADFQSLREEGSYYVDKTALVDEILDASAKVLLLPRPRRFGKTLNLSMVRCFLEKSAEDRAALFAGLAVASSEQARPHFQRYPTIFLTFKDVKESSWEHCREAMAEVLAEAYREHRYLLDGDLLAPEQAEAFTAILQRRATEIQYREALRHLSRHLAEHHREKVVILIDEYDTPIHAGFSHGYYDQAISFFRGLLSGGLKDNPHLFKGILTGILRVAKESIFSGLNNLAVYSILRSEFATRFGFTEADVARLAEEVGQRDLLPGIRAWYNGYLFGGQVIYNPWSVLNFLDSADKEFRPYWVSTSSNEIVRELLLSGPRGVREELEALLGGGSVDKPIHEDIALRDVSLDDDAVWSVLLFSGYLKAVDVRMVDRRLCARLALPNEEVIGAVSDMVRSWLSAAVGGSAEVEALLKALLAGDARTVERHLSTMLKVSLSFHDTAGRSPERVYHGFVVGLLANLGPRYEVRSNRESGFGRCDVMILPRAPDQPGVVLELKAVDTEEGETPEAALSSALQQIRDKDYAAELRVRGARPIHALAAVFDGKRAFVRSAPPG